MKWRSSSRENEEDWSANCSIADKNPFLGEEGGAAFFRFLEELLRADSLTRSVFASPSKDDLKVMAAIWNLRALVR